MKFIFKLLILINLQFIFSLFLSLQITSVKAQTRIIFGNEQTDKYLPLLKNKNVGIVANHTSVINNKHIVDSLLSLSIKIMKIFSPEHGFRGDIDAGEYFNDYIDSLTKIQVISLYGKHLKPTQASLKNIDIVIFDIQDVGVRFFTYISTLHNMMEACAEKGIEMLILDRPNPNGYYVDGPVLDPKFKSFVGKHPIPLVYGLTIGELALMINGEGWLKNKIKCNLTIIPCINYDHNTRFELKINPSPNLNCTEAIYLYPSLGLFEGTIISVGRGTYYPFRIFGHPQYPDTSFYFIPQSIKGMSINPLYKNEKCYGVDLRNIDIKSLKNNLEINLNYIITAYNNFPDKNNFFNNFFNYLAGNDKLKEQIINGKSADEIKKSWNNELEIYLQKRRKYLLYADFNN